MDCPRCGGTLETYELNGREAYVCSDCGYVNTPVEHQPERKHPEESWDEAIERFHEKLKRKVSQRE